MPNCQKTAVRKFGFAVAVLSMCGHNNAVAQERASALTLGDFRVGMFSGAFVPNSLKFTGTGTLGGSPVSSTGRIKIDPGAAVAGFVGYTPNPYVNIDVNVGKAWNRLDSLE